MLTFMLKIKVCCQHARYVNMKISVSDKKKLLLNPSITDCYLYQLLSFHRQSYKNESVQISRSVFEQNVSEIILWHYQFAKRLIIDDKGE